MICSQHSRPHWLPRNPDSDRLCYHGAVHGPGDASQREGRVQASDGNSSSSVAYMNICIQLAAISTAARASPDPGAGKARAELVASRPCEAGPHLNLDYGRKCYRHPVNMNFRKHVVYRLHPELSRMLAMEQVLCTFYSYVVIGTPYAMGVDVLHMRSAVNLRAESFDSSILRYCSRPQGLTQSSCSLFSEQILGERLIP